MADPSLPPAASAAPSLFDRRIDFHPARNPYSPAAATASGGFRLETLNSGARALVPSSAPLATGSNKRSGGGGGGGEFYEHGLDPELSFRTTFRRIGAGLQNLGNTCFLNSVLQCLTYTEPFAAYLQSGKHKSTCHTAGFCALCALQNHVNNALQSTGKIVSPLHLVKNLRCVSRSFRNSRQEDAHEYMVNLLESMHKCCLPSGVPSESPGAYEKSLVHKIFGGRLRSQVKCMQCSYSSNKFDPFLDLSLEIVKADSLRKALTHFTAVEQLDGGDRQYQCQRCKKKVRALKQLTIHKPPYVLTIHLKRFSYVIPGQKIDKKVEFEPALDLKPFVSEIHEGNLKYTLYGVLVHAGWSTHSGHYYCFIRTSSGMWHSLDDNKVTQVSEKTVLSQKAYMLFYVRDRNSAIKKSVDVVHKDSIPANGLGNKVLPQSTSGLNGSLQDNVVDKKLKASMQSSATAKNDSTSHGRFISVMDSSVEQLIQKDALFQKDDQNLLKEAQTLQNNDRADQEEAFISQSNAGVLSKGVKQTIPKNPIELQDRKPTCDQVIDDLFQMVQSSGCKVEVKSNNLLARPNFSGILHPTSEKCKEKLLTENGTHENGGAVDGNVLNNVTLLKMNNSVNQTKPNNNDVGSENKESNILQCQKDGESLSELEENKLSNIVKKATATGFPKEVLQVTAKVSSRTRAKQKQKKLARLPFFGPNKLFLASVSLRISKKHKRCKKRRVSSGNVMRDELLEDNDQGTSTSEVAKVIDSDSIHSRKQCSHSKLNSENNILGARDFKNSEGEPVDSKARDVHERSGKNGATLATEMTVRGMVQNQDDFVSLLIRGSKETTVARWDDTGSESFQIREEAQNGSIGYVLDEWDEEYDRGKSKKIKKSRHSYEGANLFQETANLKARQKMKLKMDPTRSGNQPFRI